MMSPCPPAVTAGSQLQLTARSKQSRPLPKNTWYRHLQVPPSTLQPSADAIHTDMLTLTPSQGMPVRISQIKIENFRAHALTDVPLTQLGCLIGENNAGKSSVLHALQFALEDKKIDDKDFHDLDQSVRVTVQLEGITDADLQRVGDNHRSRVSAIIEDGMLTIVRTQSRGAKAESKYMKMSPRDSSWSREVLDEATKGKTSANLRKAAVELKPELNSILPEKPKKDEVVSAWQGLIDSLPTDQLIEMPSDYPSGISASIKPLFPSIIYIEAVKDASIETKATGNAAFAKLLGMLFEEVQDQFESIEKEFQAVHRKLSRHLNSDGDWEDGRLAAVQRIESVIEEYVQMSFPGIHVRMDVPAPTLSMLLDSADLQIDDGHMGSVATKGDGLKRTILFALLRAYASMRDQGLSASEARESPGEAPSKKSSYLLLFEEPELYLHPRAQRQLMSALVKFSQDHQVLVTTHSPGFFQPGTKGFTRLHKTKMGVTAQPVDLVDMTRRDEYQVIRHENNEAAFFAKTVVLVEGDSDTFVYPHLAKLFSEQWDDVERNVMFVKIEGKGNVTRYRDFFDNFGVPVHVITDLDALSSGFNHLTSTKAIKDAHAKLMTLVGDHLVEPSEPNAKKTKKIVKTYTAKELWTTAQTNFETWRTEKSDASAHDITDALTRLFGLGHSDAKLEILADPPSEEIELAIDDVVSSLAIERTYVLRRGDLEAYCGTTAGTDKVTTAIEFCDATTSLEQFEQIHDTDADGTLEELRKIFSSIYREDSPAEV